MQFHQLKVAEVERNTPDAVSVHFEVPSNLKEEFQYKPGQYLILQVGVEGQKHRRAYSLCSCPEVDDHLIVTSKRVEGGIVSNYLNDELQAGDTLEVYPPQGNFTPDINPEHEKQYVLLGAGSGITPLMSILQTVLLKELKSSVTLFYGNRNEESIIFKDKLDQLEEKFEDRFQVIHSLSQPSDDWEGLKGRLSKFKLKRLLKKEIGEEQLLGCEYFICGPSGMMKGAQSTLEDKEVPDDKIHVEYFTAPLPELDEDGESGQQRAAEGQVVEGEDVNIEEQEGKGSIKDKEHELMVKPDQSILEAAIEDGLDPPFACQMGICTTCRATLISGQITMDQREGLSDDEVEEGYVLTCQSHPLSDDVVVEYG
jgi:ring-1,2-phenylacetyl-CoA epoxidase subunit PaaE